jgi:alpha-D-ribose 1-methylphosphonate 5-triphosphate synthase subunit PhnL
MYRSTTDTIGLSTAGTERILINSAGNVSVDSGTLFVNAANNLVGIGTTSPSAKLHINGTDVGLIIQDTANIPGMRLLNSTGSLRVDSCIKRGRY